MAVHSAVPYTKEFCVPASRTFPKQIKSIFEQGRKVWEFTNWADHPDYRKKGFFTELMRCCYSHITNLGADDLVGEVNPLHAKFLSLILFENIGEGKYNNDKVVCIRLSLDNIRRRYEERDEKLEEEAFLVNFFGDKNPYFDKTKEWENWAQKEFKETDVLEKLLKESLRQRTFTSKEIETIKSRWTKFSPTFA